MNLNRYFYPIGGAVTALAIGFNSWLLPALADDASTDWNSTPGFQSADQRMVDLQTARQLYLGRQDLLGERTYCQVAGACQTNNQTNVNGYTSVTVENSDGVTVDTNTSTDHTDQNNNAAVVDDIGNLVIN